MAVSLHPIHEGNSGNRVNGDGGDDEEYNLYGHENESGNSNEGAREVSPLT